LESARLGYGEHIADDPLGSDTRAGATNYDHLYANIIKWQEYGWIDYTLPQLYWQIGHPLADFKTLAFWWQNHTYGRGMYIGLGLYKSDPESDVKEWKNPGELPKQIRLLREIKGIEGVAFYSSKHFNRNLQGLRDSLMYNLYEHPALVPQMSWLGNQAPQPVHKISRSGRTVKWKVKNPEHVYEKPRAFVVYLYKKGEVLNPENPENIHIIKGNGELNYKFERINAKREKYEVRISVVNRLNKESWLSPPVRIRL
jgi:hypothetical protein